MENKNLPIEEKIEQISKLVVGMRYCDWCKISHGINQKFSSANNKITLDNAEGIQKSINLDFL